MCVSTLSKSHSHTASCAMSTMTSILDIRWRVCVRLRPSVENSAWFPYSGIASTSETRNYLNAQQGILGAQTQNCNAVFVLCGSQTKPCPTLYVLCGSKKTQRHTVYVLCGLKKHRATQYMYCVARKNTMPHSIYTVWLKHTKCAHQYMCRLVYITILRPVPLYLKLQR